MLVILRCRRSVCKRGVSLPEKEKVLTRNDLKKLARLRLKEAEHLYKRGLYDGCVYLSGYAVEFALKARVCRFLRLATCPDESERDKQYKQFFWTHNFDRLKLLAGLRDEIAVTKNKDLYDNWSKVTEWNAGLRYSPRGTCDNKRAEEMLASIRGRPNGVLTWLTKRW
jgi:hypothetical protein